MSKEKQEISKEILSPDELDILPIFYRFFVKKRTENVDELRVGARFSESLRHRAIKYQTWTYNRNISPVNFSEEIFYKHDEEREFQ